jgi:hypothetical protein
MRMRHMLIDFVPLTSAPEEEQALAFSKVCSQILYDGISLDELRPPEPLNVTFNVWPIACSFNLENTSRDKRTGVLHCQ